MRPSCPSTLRITHLLAALLLIGARARAETTYTVTYQDFELAADGEKPQQFTDTIDAMDGVSAKLLPDPPAGSTWRNLPRGLSLPEWISVVRVKVGAQCDFFAFNFSDRDGTVSYTAHRPSRVRQVLYWFNVPPGPDQLPMNAIRECATDFLFARERSLALKRRRLQVQVGPWSGGKDSEADARAGGGDGLLNGGAQAEVETDLTPLEALSFGAAYEAGWQPTAGPAENTLKLEIREEFSVYFSLRAKLLAGGKESSLLRRKIPREKLYPYLVRVLGQLAPGTPYATFAYLGSHHAQLLGWRDGLALAAESDSPKVLRPASGKVLWQIEAQPRQKPLLRVDEDRAGGPLYRYDRGLARIDWETGESTALATVGPETSAFDVSAKEEAAVIREGVLEVYAAGKLLWACEAGKFAGTPLWCGELLLAAESDGTIQALAPARKEVVWKRKVASGAARLSRIDDLLLVEDGAQVHAIEPSTGKQFWKHEIGDVLVAPPAKVEVGILLASKDRKIQLLDAASGAVKAERSWPTWVKGFSLLKAKPRLCVVVDLRNRITVLDTNTLKSLAEHSFQVPLRPMVWYAPDTPLVWRAAKDPGSEADEFDDLVGESRSMRSLLAQDDAGFVYLLPLPR